MKLDNIDGFCFDFTDAIEAFVFDEKDRTKSRYHGAPMKAVDIVVEFNESYLYVELKDFHDPDLYNIKLAIDNDDLQTRHDSFKHLKRYLTYKYRDSYLFRSAEHKVDKPIHYLCLLTFDNALNTRMQKALTKELPVGKPSRLWQQEIAKSCQVLNIESWNRNFPKWPVTRSNVT